MIDLPAAKSLLREPDLVPKLLDIMERMSGEDLDSLSPLVFDVIDMEDRTLSLTTLKRIIALRPEWVNEPGFGVTSQDNLLIRAVKNVCPDTVDFLLEAGANTHYTNVRRMNALDCAARQAFSSPVLGRIYALLIEKGGFAPEQKDQALYYAALNANLEATRVLLANGAGAGFTTEKRHGTALGAACMNTETATHTFEIVSAMLETTEGRQVIDQGWGLPGENIGAPLHCAAYKGNMKVLSLLLATGARVNPTSEQSQDRPDTPLMAAAMGAKLNAIKLLISSGADATLTNSLGRNALHFLAKSNAYLDRKEVPEFMLVKVSESLIAAGADPLLKDDRGMTPEDVARANESFLLADHLAASASALGLESSTILACPSAIKSGPRI